MREFDLSELKHTFHTKPLLIGGRAMEYYQLRPSGDDIDFVISRDDYTALAQKYPDHTQDIFGDKGICVGQFELWMCICLFDYEFLSAKAIEKQHYHIISLEKLLFLKALGMNEPKYHTDLTLIVEKILNIQYGKDAQPE